MASILDASWSATTSESSSTSTLPDLIEQTSSAEDSLPHYFHHTLRLYPSEMSQETAVAPTEAAPATAQFVSPRHPVSPARLNSLLQAPTGPLSTVEPARRKLRESTMKQRHPLSPQVAANRSRKSLSPRALPAMVAAAPAPDPAPSLFDALYAHMPQIELIHEDHIIIPTREQNIEWSRREAARYGITLPENPDIELDSDIASDPSDIESDPSDIESDPPASESDSDMPPPEAPTPAYVREPAYNFPRPLLGRHPSDQIQLATYIMPHDASLVVHAINALRTKLYELYPAPISHENAMLLRPVDLALTKLRRQVFELLEDYHLVRTVRNCPDSTIHVGLLMLRN